MGFAAGNPRLIKALTRMKSYLDYGAFTPIQVAAVAALTGPQECIAEMRALYKDRRDVLIKGLVSAGWDIPCPDGSMFAWAPIPPRYASLGSVEQGDGHVRIALVENNHRLRQAVRNIRAFLQSDSNVADDVETPVAAK
jgi:alanine-synthesizing transaminase